MSASNATGPEVLFVAVNYRSYEEALSYVDSVQSLMKRGFADCVVVDNSPPAAVASNEGAIAELSRKCRYLYPGTNLGYFPGAKYGLERYSIDVGAWPPWIVISNVDVILASEDLPAILREWRQKDASVACIGPSIVDYSGYEKNPYIMRRPSRGWIIFSMFLYSNVVIANAWVALSLCKRWLMSRCFPFKRVLLPRGAEIYACHGSVVILRGEVIKNTPKILNLTFLYAEENVVAELVRASGSRIVMDSALQFRHEGSVSTGIWKSRVITRYMYNATRLLWDEFYK